ncbi:MAG: SIS domain-containing protein [Candidatus Limnocylindrales bacterium]
MALIDEIREQPEVAARLLAEAGGEVEAVCRAIRATDPAHVVIAARGTSDHAAIYAQYALGVMAGLSVGLATPSVHSLYGASPDYGRALVIGISQSGASPDVVGVIRSARSQGALTLAITNTPGSDMAEAAEHHLALRAGPERAVAATKTYTSTLLLLAMLAAGLSDVDAEADLARVPAALRATLEQDDEAARIAADMASLSRCVILGRGYHYATAREWSLKLKELSYTLADPYSTADFIHGPLALIEAGFPTFCVAPRGATETDMGEVIERLGGELGASLLILSDDPAVRARGTWSLELPVDLPEWLMPIVSIVPGQLHARHVTVAKGGDPEQPRSISKVTRTT